MKSVFRLLPFLFLLGLSAYLPGVRAETCRANIGQTTVNIPNIKYLPTLPVNTQKTSAMADNGSGIPDFALQKVFERFYSLPRASGLKSSGLGLAFVQEVARLHRGAVTLCNRPEGGAEASIRLPRA